jgi:PHP family Zn ribbon phosphoesterase
MQTKKVWEIYNSLIQKFENELNILLNISKEKLKEEKINEQLIEIIIRNRQGLIKVIPGYDGEYGIAQIEEQKKLF